MDKDEFMESIQSYQGISNILKNFTYQEIVSLVSEIASLSPRQLEQWSMGGYLKDRSSSVYRFVLEDLLTNINYYDWLYERLADEPSQKVFTRLIQFRLVPDVQLLKLAYDGTNCQYFDKTIVFCDENDVFVDCGGFAGDTTEDYIRQYGKYKKIYVYEPSADNIQVCRKKLEKYKDVLIKECDVGEKHISSFLNAIPGREAAEVISLDDDIKDKVTFIKMNMEGEIPAILGAKNHIRNDSPKLAVSVFHIISDMWEIPKLLDTINSDYKFYLRHYDESQNKNTVLYAIPSDQKKVVRDVSAKKKKIVTIAPHDRGWTNVELIKDCGLIPYILYKNYNYEVSMVGADEGPYPYLEKFIKGVKMEFLPSSDISDKVQYIINNGKDIDVLLIRGCHPANHLLAPIYKQINPAGRVYVGLDANSGWMDRIIWDDPQFRDFLDNCDVITTSCISLQKFLNKKWPWKIEYIPNGWYDFSHPQKKPDFEKKKNRILTVGRLGTWQKATEVLLEAFARIADKIPDWEIRLVGGMEGQFETYIKEYFERSPHLIGQVKLVGVITDREKLYMEYRDAKIFALPSNLEGGPNVIAEALHAGCVTAVTKFDAYEEATDYGRCGLAAEIRDVDGFAGILYRLCTEGNLEQLSEYAYQYSRRHFDMESIVAKVNEMLFGEVSYGSD